MSPSIRNHAMELLVKASHHAKHMRIRELNHLEAELMAAETLLHELRDNEYPEEELLGFNTEIKAIREIIKQKKLKVY
ncbi:hypothetical protein JW711_01460 [Candidatus Woesearchaeota archaeon]|nr:hypothetical protein [Candidatus Woesearchaeota archaeon]